MSIKVNPKDFDSGTTPNGEELIPAYQSGWKKLTLSSVKDWLATLFEPKDSAIQAHVVATGNPHNITANDIPYNNTTVTAIIDQLSTIVFTGNVLLTEPNTNVSYRLGVSLDVDTNQPTLTLTEVSTVNTENATTMDDGSFPTFDDGELVEWV